VAEAKAKADRIREDSERVLAAATQRRDSINAQLTNVRQMLATLSGGGIANPLEPAEPERAEPEQPVPATEQRHPSAAAEYQSLVTDVQDGEDTAHTDDGADTGEQADGEHADGDQADGEHADDHSSEAGRQAAAVKG
jgi:hypothetical protein